MYKEGNILYFTPFYFKNGNTAKPKYFVVLKNIDNDLLLASLPSSKDFVPSEYENQRGCIEVPGANFNCFVIDSAEPVTVCNKCFPRTTYIYGFQLDTYQLTDMSTNYVHDGIDYNIFGEMKPAIFRSLLHCLKNSRVVPKKYLKIL